MEKKLYAVIRTCQDTDDDYNRVEAVFSGLDVSYCEGNSQPVINYFSEWEDEFNRLQEEEPYIAKGTDTRYLDENGVYTLLYNSSVGGMFLMYREATDEEWRWYGEMRELKTENERQWKND